MSSQFFVVPGRGAKQVGASVGDSRLSVGPDTARPTAPTKFVNKGGGNG